MYQINPGVGSRHLHSTTIRKWVIIRKKEKPNYIEENKKGYFIYIYIINRTFERLSCYSILWNDWDSLRISVFRIWRVRDSDHSILILRSPLAYLTVHSKKPKKREQSRSLSCLGRSRSFRPRAWGIWIWSGSYSLMKHITCVVSEYNTVDGL